MTLYICVCVRWRVCVCVCVVVRVAIAWNAMLMIPMLYQKWEHCNEPQTNRQTDRHADRQLDRQICSLYSIFYMLIC